MKPFFFFFFVISLSSFFNSQNLSSIISPSSNSYISSQRHYILKENRTTIKISGNDESIKLILKEPPLKKKYSLINGFYSIPVFNKGKYKFQFSLNDSEKKSNIDDLEVKVFESTDIPTCLYFQDLISFNLTPFNITDMNTIKAQLKGDNGKVIDFVCEKGKFTQKEKANANEKYTFVLYELINGYYHLINSVLVQFTDIFFPSSLYIYNNKINLMSNCNLEKLPMPISFQSENKTILIQCDKLIKQNGSLNFPCGSKDISLLDFGLNYISIGENNYSFIMVENSFSFERSIRRIDEESTIEINKLSSKYLYQSDSEEITITFKNSIEEGSFIALISIIEDNTVINANQCNNSSDDSLVCTFNLSSSQCGKYYLKLQKDTNEFFLANNNKKIIIIILSEALPILQNVSPNKILVNGALNKTLELKYDKEFTDLSPIAIILKNNITKDEHKFTFTSPNSSFSQSIIISSNEPLYGNYELITQLNDIDYDNITSTNINLIIYNSDQLELTKTSEKYCKVLKQDEIEITFNQELFEGRISEVKYNDSDEKLQFKIKNDNNNTLVINTTTLPFDSNMVILIKDIINDNYLEFSLLLLKNLTVKDEKHLELLDSDNNHTIEIEFNEDISNEEMFPIELIKNETNKIINLTNCNINKNKLICNIDKLDIGNYFVSYQNECKTQVSIEKFSIKVIDCSLPKISPLISSFNNTKFNLHYDNEINIGESIKEIIMINNNNSTKKILTKDYIYENESKSSSFNIENSNNYVGNFTIKIIYTIKGINTSATLKAQVLIYDKELEIDEKNTKIYDITHLIKLVNHKIIFTNNYLEPTRFKSIKLFKNNNDLNQSLSFIINKNNYSNEMQITTSITKELINGDLSNLSIKIQDIPTNTTYEAKIYTYLNVKLLKNYTILPNMENIKILFDNSFNQVNLINSFAFKNCPEFTLSKNETCNEKNTLCLDISNKSNFSLEKDIIECTLQLNQLYLDPNFSIVIVDPKQKIPKIVSDDKNIKIPPNQKTIALNFDKDISNYIKYGLISLPINNMEMSYFGNSNNSLKLTFLSQIENATNFILTIAINTTYNFTIEVISETCSDNNEIISYEKENAECMKCSQYNYSSPYYYEGKCLSSCSKESPYTINYTCLTECRKQYNLNGKECTFCSNKSFFINQWGQGIEYSSNSDNYNSKAPSENNFEFKCWCKDESERNFCSNLIYMENFIEVLDSILLPNNTNDKMTQIIDDLIEYGKNQKEKQEAKENQEKIVSAISKTFNQIFTQNSPSNFPTKSFINLIGLSLNLTEELTIKENNQTKRENLIENVSNIINNIHNLSIKFGAKENLENTSYTEKDEFGYFELKRWSTSVNSFKSYSDSLSTKETFILPSSLEIGSNTKFFLTSITSKAKKLLKQNSQTTLRNLDEDLELSTIILSLENFNGKSLDFNIDLEESDFNLELALYYQKMGIDIYNPYDPAFQPCYYNEKFDYDLTQKYRRQLIFQNRTFGTEDDRCKYNSANYSSNSIVLSCNIDAMANQSSFKVFLQKTSLDGDITHVDNLPTKCAEDVNDIMKNFAFWLFLVLFVLFILFDIIIMIKGVQTMNKEDNEDKGVKSKKKIEMAKIENNYYRAENEDHSEIKDFNDIHLDFTPTKNNPNSGSNNKNNSTQKKSVGEIIVSNFFSLHPFCSILNATIKLAPTWFNGWMLLYNILNLFGFNALYFNETMIEDRIYDKHRNNFGYPMKTEFEKIMSAIASSVVLAVIARLIVIEKAYSESKAILIRRLIAVVFMLAVNVFFFYYCVVFCAFYRNTQYGWLYSGIWSLMLNYIAFGPVYIFIISLIEITGCERCAYYMKVLFPF